MAMLDAFIAFIEDYKTPPSKVAMPPLFLPQGIGFRFGQPTEASDSIFRRFYIASPHD